MQKKVAWYRLLHSHLKVLSKNDLKGTGTEGGFERAFETLFYQDVQTFRALMLLNLYQLEKQLDKEEFQETGSMVAFRALKTQMNERQMQSKEGKVYSSKALDTTLVVTKCSGTKSDKQDTSSSSGNYLTHVVDANIRLVNDQVLEKINIELEHSVAKLLAENEKLHKENEHLKQTYKDLYDSIKKTRVQTKDHNDSLIAQMISKTVENADLNARIQEKVFANVALKIEFRKLKENSVDTMFSKPSTLGKPVLQPPRNQSVVRQPNTFKSE
ncbi:hypothetical protein Tco_1443687 [Tanacetum coccineum]